MSRQEEDVLFLMYGGMAEMAPLRYSLSQMVLTAGWSGVEGQPETVSTVSYRFTHSSAIFYHILAYSTSLNTWYEVCF